MEATLVQAGELVEFTADAAYSAGDVVQLRDGRAGVVTVDIESGKLVGVRVKGVALVTKTANIVILDGGKVFWDHSANAGHFKPADDRDFYLGAAYGDAASAATTMLVELNVEPVYVLDAARDPVLTAVIKTSGAPEVYRRGGTQKLFLTSTSEAQKVDVLSKDGVSQASKLIVEGAFTVISDGSGSAADFNVGVASGTHNTDADAITHHCFLHLDANNTAINAQAKGGATQTAVDTTKTAPEGTRKEFWMDCRDPADVQIYIDGVLVLPSSTFNINTSGTLKLLAHLEKTSAADTYDVDLEFLRARIAQQ